MRATAATGRLRLFELLAVLGLIVTATGHAQARVVTAALTISASADASVVVRVPIGERLFSTGDPFVLAQQVRLRSAGTWSWLRVTDLHGYPIFEMLDDAAVWPEPLVTYAPSRADRSGPGAYRITLAGDRPVTATLPITGSRRAQHAVATTPARVTLTQTPATLPVGPLGLLRTAVTVRRAEAVELIRYRQEVAAATTSAFCLTKSSICNPLDGRSAGAGFVLGGDLSVVAYPEVQPGTYTEMADFETAGTALSQGIVRIETDPLNFESAA